MIASIRSVLRRELTARNKAGAILAILTCPCHVVMLIFVLGGTAGAWLAAIRAWLFLLFTLLFLAGLWLMFRPDQTSCDSEACEMTDNAR